MAISFRGAGTVTSGYGSGTGGITVATDVSGLSNGDLMFLIAGRTDDAGAYNAVTGWTNITELTGTNPGADPASSGDRCISVWYRVASSEPASYSVTHTDTANQGQGGVILAFTGQDTIQPLDVTSVSDFTQYNNDDATPPAITTVTNGSVVVIIGMVRAFAADASSFAQPSGYSEALDTADSNFRLSVGYKTVASAGLETPGTIVTSPVGTDRNDWLLGTLAIRVAGAGGSGVSPSMYMGRQLGKGLISS